MCLCHIKEKSRSIRGHTARFYNSKRVKIFKFTAKCNWATLHRKASAGLLLHGYQFRRDFEFLKNFDNFWLPSNKLILIGSDLTFQSCTLPDRIHFSSVWFIPMKILILTHFIYLFYLKWMKLYQDSDSLFNNANVVHNMSN